MTDDEKPETPEQAAIRQGLAARLADIRATMQTRAETTPEDEARAQALLAAIEAGLLAAKARAERFKVLNGNAEIDRLQARPVATLSPKERRFVDRWLRDGHALIREDTAANARLVALAEECDQMLRGDGPQVEEGRRRLQVVLEALKGLYSGH